VNFWEFLEENGFWVVVAILTIIGAIGEVVNKC